MLLLSLRIKKQALMKKILFLLWLLPAACIAQTDSVKVNSRYIYGRIFIQSRSFSVKISVAYDFGRTSSSVYWTETEFAKLTGELVKIDNEIDALNYLSIQGWEVVAFNEFRDRPNSYLIRKKVQ